MDKRTSFVKVIIMNNKTYTPTIIILALVMLIESIATGIPIAYFPNYATSLGASISSLGIFTSSFLVAYALLSPKIGGLSDSYGRKKLIMFGLAGDVIFGLAQGVAPNWIWLLAIRTINGAVASAAMVSGQALLMDLADPEKRGEIGGFVMSMQMMGHMVGPMFGGIIQWASVAIGFSLLASYRIPFFLDSLLAAIALVLVAWKIPDIKPSSNDASMMGMDMGMGMNIGGNDVDVKSVEEFSNGVLGQVYIILGYTFINGLIEGLTMILIVLFLGDKFGMQPVTIGTFVSVTGIVGMFATMMSGKMSDKIGRKPLIVVGSALSYLASVFLPIANTLSVALIISAIWSIADNTGGPALMALKTDLIPAEKRGKWFGYFGSASMIGMVIGPVVGTYLYGTNQGSMFNFLGMSVPGYGLPFVVFGLLGLGATLAVQLLVKETKNQTPVSSMLAH